MAKRKTKAKNTKKKNLPLPMEFNPALERYEPVLPTQTSTSKDYPKTFPTPSSNERRNWTWVIVILILLLLILAFFLFIARNTIINPPNIPEFILSLDKLLSS